MKLIIDIPELDYECAKQRWMKGIAFEMDYYISKGTPLDDVKAEIEKEENIWYHDCEPYNDWKHFDVIRVDTVFDILDSIGKTESEE